MCGHDLRDMSALALRLVCTYHANHSCPCHTYTLYIIMTSLTRPELAFSVSICGDGKIVWLPHHRFCAVESTGFGER